MHALSTKNLILVAITLGVFLILLLPTLLLAEETKPAKIEEGVWYESILWTFVNGFFGLLVWIAGTLLNIAVGQFVVGFGDLFKSQGLGFAVDHLWGLVRDIFNLAFIFGLVYIGFKLILRTGESDAKKALVSIILAALLVNFSLFFAKAIVDFSNIAAAQIAHGFYDGVPGEYKVSDKFINVLGLSSIWGADGKFLENVATGQGNGLGYIFGTMLLFIITAFVFFAGALLLLIRFVVLNFYLILSPLMFLGWVFPNLKSHAQDYWTGFLNQAFLAPVYLLMLYFAYYILKEFQNLTLSNKNYAAIFSGNDPGNNINIIPFFVITCVFLLAAVSVAKKMSQKTAVSAVQTAASWADSTSRSVTGKYAFGLPAIAGQRTIGKATNYLANTGRFKSLASSDKFYGGAARTALKGARAVADSSFDARKISGFGKSAGIGEGGSGGYVTKLKAQEKEDKAFAETLEVKTRDADGNLTKGAADTIQEAKKNNIEIQKLDETKKAINDRLNEQNEVLTKKKDELKSINKPLEEQVATLAKQLANETNEANVKKLTSQIDIAKAQIATNRDNYSSTINNLQSQLNETKDELVKNTKEREKRENEIELKTEAEIRYKDVNAFRASREKDAKFYSSNWTTYGGSAVIGGAALAGGVALAPAVVLALASAVGINSIGEMNKRGANILLSTYGSDGTAKMKSEKKKKDLKILAEVQKEIGDTPETSATPKT